MFEITLAYQVGDLNPLYTFLPKYFLDLDFFIAFRLGDLDLDLDLDLFPPRKEPTSAPAIAPDPFEPLGAKRPPMAAPVRAFVNRSPPSIFVSVVVKVSIFVFFLWVHEVR